MRIVRFLCFLAVPVTLLLLTGQGRLEAKQSGRSHLQENPSAHVRQTAEPSVKQAGSSIKEIIPDNYKARYFDWKNEFLSTETGRRQWDLYEQNPRFILTITVTRENAHGARTGKYKWNEGGGLIAATITLGCRIDEGYPNPIYYPVMNSLSPRQPSHAVSGTILAATKIAHEFGHVNRMATVDGNLCQLQARLIPAYNKILLGNGRNTRDPRLLELARQMGGTPVEIWEDHEYWGEANAMVYLCDRITKESLRCTLLSRIKRTIQMYAENYADRFVQIAQTQVSPSTCGW
jgi:hypothetical protein